MLEGLEGIGGGDGGDGGDGWMGGGDWKKFSHARASGARRIQIIRNRPSQSAIPDEICMEAGHNLGFIIVGQEAAQFWG